MKGIWRLVSIRGIPVLVHWSFGLILLWAGYRGYEIDGWHMVGFAVLLTVLLFACVLLHELGHSLMARRFGVQTRSILLLPVGGVAALERMPRRPLHEFLIAIAGPMVNVVIALVLFACIGIPDSAGYKTWRLETFAELLMYMNLVMIGFNMIPAFPMDGGRVLRALLATRLSYVRATGIASLIGQLAAFIMFIYGLNESPFISLIGVMIFFGARKEYEMVRIRAMMEQGDPPVSASRPFINIG